MDMRKMKKRMLIAGGLISLPVMTWALLAWEPFSRLLGHFFPEMFYDEVGRFVPYTHFDALLTTIQLSVYASPTVLAIFLVYVIARSVRRRGLGMTVEKGAMGVTGILSVFWMVMIAVAGFVMYALEVDEKYVQAEDEEREKREKEWQMDNYF